MGESKEIKIQLSGRIWRIIEGYWCIYEWLKTEEEESVYLGDSKGLMHLIS